MNDNPKCQTYGDDSDDSDGIDELGKTEREIKCPTCGSYRNEIDELEKAEREIELLRAMLVELEKLRQLPAGMLERLWISIEVARGRMDGSWVAVDRDIVLAIADALKEKK